MACFLVPAGEAIVTTIIQKNMKKREERANKEEAREARLSWSRKLSWLNKLLWGGTILLAFEHIWHGEVILWPPFLTAMKNPADIGPMLHEMATIGGAMVVFVTMIWAIIVMVAELKIKTLPAMQIESVKGGGK